MGEWIAAYTGVLLFLVLFRAVGLLRRTKAMLGRFNQSLAILRSNELSDLEKERATRQASLAVFGDAAVLAVLAAMCVGVPAGVVWLLCLGFSIEIDAVVDLSLSPLFLIVATATALAEMTIIRYRDRRIAARPESTDPKLALQNRYSKADRALHRFAFATTSAQIGMTGLENSLVRKEMAQHTVERPVFVTALPRAGTTIMLETLAKLDDFVTHSYRHMPFVLTPVLWNRFRRLFSTKAEATERAHGDGILIDFDSPEALEEMLWVAFWRRKYRGETITPWKTKGDREFEQFYTDHIKKLFIIRQNPSDTPPRYLAKNNLHIARLKYLEKIFKNPRIIVLFRDPLQHAASLLKQHRSFVSMNEADPFSKKYMAGIGHFDIGGNLKPVDFDGWYTSQQPASTMTLDFWLAYWVAAYRNAVHTHGDQCLFVSFDELLRSPEEQLARIADAIGIANREDLIRLSTRFRQPKPHPTESDLPAELVDAANTVHQELLALTRS